MAKFTRVIFRILGACLWLALLLCTPARAELTAEQMAAYVHPPIELGTRDESLPAWQLLNSGGALIGYIFESRELAPIPGFSGKPMNLLVAIDLDGNFLDVTILDQSEPVFVSGLGERPFHEFLSQYRGKSLASNIKISSVQGKSEKNVSNNIQLDGVTKATASVRIANQSILAAALKVARKHLAHIAPKPVAYPRKDLFEEHSWQSLLDAGLVKHLRVSNGDIEKLYAGTDFEGLDPEALDDPEGLYLDIWVADLGLPTVARNVLNQNNLTDLGNQLSPFEEPILVLANGRHSLVLDNFVRNTVPDRLAAQQGKFPVSIRDADLEVSLRPGLPDFDQAMVFRMDTRLGFDPSSPWALVVKAAREKGIFRPEVALRDIAVPMALPPRYFESEASEADNGPVWLQSWLDQAPLLAALIALLLALGVALSRLERSTRTLSRARPILLIAMVFFIGWYGQGQLSIVTVIGTVKALFDGQDFSFLLYDPISLVLWAFVILSFFLWGRGTFCGWLCPYGALQELSHSLGRLLKLPEYRLPTKVHKTLKHGRYLALALTLGIGVTLPSLSDSFVEIEPFKTAITLQFDRAWPYVAYAAFWLVLGLFLFKGFCRYLCPLGAVMTLGGKLRLLDWLARRSDCGSPCQLCHVRCRYDAIDRDGGAIQYGECFQCLECVDIMQDDKQCVPLVLATKQAERQQA